MTTRLHQREIDDIIILGAGASKTEGSPLQADLFRTFLSSVKSMGPDQFPPQLVQSLAAFFQKFFGLDVEKDDLDAMSFPTFEEALGVLDLAHISGDEFEGWPGGPRESRVSASRDDLVMLIAIALDGTLRRSQAEHHRRLVQNLQENGTLLRTAFLSFNYDIMIDNVLSGFFPDVLLDYGFELANYSRARGDTGRYRRPRLDRSVTLLKVHGSLNWIYCGVCRSITLTPERKGAVDVYRDPERTRCSDCDSPMRPIVVPPTFFKALSNPFLVQTWLLAERVARKAKRLIFCGYSFPDADIYFKYLLKRVELNGRNRLREVVVVNDHPFKTDEERRAEWVRYRRFIHQGIELRFLKGVGFADFAANPDIIEDAELFVPKAPPTPPRERGEGPRRRTRARADRAS